MRLGIIRESGFAVDVHLVDDVEHLPVAHAIDGGDKPMRTSGITGDAIGSRVLGGEVPVGINLDSSVGKAQIGAHRVGYGHVGVGARRGHLKHFGVGIAVTVVPLVDLHALVGIDGNRVASDAGEIERLSAAVVAARIFARDGSREGAVTVSVGAHVRGVRNRHGVAADGIGAKCVTRTVFDRAVRDGGPSDVLGQGVGEDVTALDIHGVRELPMQAHLDGIANVYALDLADVRAVDRDTARGFNDVRREVPARRLRGQNK